jgi:hypothetical protein
MPRNGNAAPQCLARYPDRSGASPQASRSASLVAARSHRQLTLDARAQESRERKQYR